MARTGVERGWKTISRTPSYAGRVKLFTHTVALHDDTRISYEVDESDNAC